MVEDDGTCEHDYVEAVDENGKLIEPAHDVCIQCGHVLY